MEGVSAENNAIYLELTSENLSRALKTAQNARALKIKLTNKHFPCLTVSIELVSRREHLGHFPEGLQVPINLGFSTIWRKLVGFIKRRDVCTNIWFLLESGLLVFQYCCDHIAFGWDPAFSLGQSTPAPSPVCACPHRITLPIRFHLGRVFPISSVTPLGDLSFSEKACIFSAASRSLYRLAVLGTHIP